MKVFYFVSLKKVYGEEKYETLSSLRDRSPGDQRAKKDNLYPAVHGVVPGLLRPGGSYIDGEGGGAVQRVYPEGT